MALGHSKLTKIEQKIKLPKSLTPRVISIVVLAPTVTAVVLLLDREGIHLVFCGLLFGALYEWCAIGRIEQQLPRFIYAGIGTLTACLLPLVGTEVGEILIYCALVAWIFGILSVLLYRYFKPMLSERIVALGLGYIIAIGAALSVRHISASGLAILSVVVVVGLTDSAAYLIGNFFGKRQLHIDVSPNKTWEGTIGGFTIGLISLGIFDAVLGWLTVKHYWMWPLMLSFAIFGDLFASALKRVADIKDSGNFLPGHGGFLDRIDSLLAFSVCTYFCLAPGSST